jgi:hypothetical protein
MRTAFSLISMYNLLPILVPHVKIKLASFLVLITVLIVMMSTKFKFNTSILAG